MRVESQAATQNNTSSSTIGSADSDMFMKLLLAQLKSQDPLAPTDANQFVSQLVQFNTLNEITQIRDYVASFAATGASE